MGELLPDGSIQGYTGICPKCKKFISTNIQGNEIGNHKCEERPDFEKAAESDPEVREWLEVVREDMWEFATKLQKAIMHDPGTKGKMLIAKLLQPVFDDLKNAQSYAESAIKETTESRKRIEELEAELLGANEIVKAYTKALDEGRITPVFH